MHPLAAIGRNIRTQDNRATGDPMFVVQELIRTYGYDDDSSYDYEWVDMRNAEIADDDEAAELEIKDDAGTSTDPWEKCYYRETWRFVTACFTEQGCKDYIELNGHNLNSPRIYVASAYRNDEWNAVRGYLKGLADTEEGE